MNNSIQRIESIYRQKNSSQGFTLIEVLIVIGIIAVLASIVIIAINPARQFAQANNAQRRSHINTILNAVYQYAIDNTGALPSTITATPTEICKTGILPATCSSSGLIDLSVLTDNEIYIIEIPGDPACPGDCNPDGVGYEIAMTPGGRVAVSAPNAGLGETISVMR